MKLKGSAVSLSQEYGRGWSLNIKLHPDNIRQARELVDELRETDVSIEVKKWRNSRSLDANAYAWVLIGKIAEATRQGKVDVYRAAIKEIGGNYTIVCVQDKALESLREGWSKNGLGWITDTIPSKIDGCTTVLLYYGSSEYDTHQMSVLIDHLVADAKELGIETLSPMDLERMMGQWQKNTA